MNAEDQKQIVQGLIERLNADSMLPEPRYTSVVSALERRALASLLGPPQDADPVGAEESRYTRATRNDSSTPLLLDLSCLTAPLDPNHVVCIDFGTAKSKAFATSVREGGDEEEDFRGFDLGLGKLDGDLDNAVYSVASSVWISDDGLMFAGSNALRLSSEANDRERLDSIKQQLSQTNHQVSLDRFLDTSINPTQVRLSHADAICFFLGYLTDLIGRELAALPGWSRHIRRRFTIPAWSTDQRKWANAELKKLVKRAQILADTFGSRWSDGIPVSEVKEAIALASKYDAELDRLLDPTMLAAEFGISEPMAAGTGRIRIDKSTKNLVLIVDVGAGTTDFGLFIVNFEKQTAIPVEPKSAAIKLAGDHIDNLLVEHILAKVEGHLDARTRERISSGLRRSGLRREKERLFNLASLNDLRLATDQLVTISLSDFLQSPGVVNFAKQIETALTEFLARVDKSFEAAAERPIMLLSGGGANLPFIRDLLRKRWNIASRAVTFQTAKPLPDAILEYDADFQREYPQLAVAMGGAMQVIDERTALAVWGGSIEKPGPLSRFAVTGS